MHNNYKPLLVAAIAISFLVDAAPAMSQNGILPGEIGTCEECVDEAETNMLKGKLDAVSFKASMLQLTTSSGARVLRFNNDTILTGAEDFSGIRQGSNLEIEYLKEAGELLAVGIDISSEVPARLASNQIDAKTLAGILSDKTEEVVIIDARSDSSFDDEHIPGAISISAGAFDKKIDMLPAKKDQLIVYYCDGTAWKLSAKSARRAEETGYTNVKVLYGGLPSWKSAGYSTFSEDTNKAASEVKSLEGVVNKEEFSKAVTSKSSDIVLLDVRSYEEFSLGTIPGAITIPADEVSVRIVEIPYGKQVYIYCKSGVRAEMVYNLLKDRGRSSKYLNNKVSVEKGGAFFIGDDTRKQ